MEVTVETDSSTEPQINSACGNIEQDVGAREEISVKHVEGSSLTPIDQDKDNTKDANSFRNGEQEVPSENHQTQRRKRCGVIDSDSDDDEAEHCKGQFDENVLPATSTEDTTVEPSLKQRLMTLCDSDSESENENERDVDHSDESVAEDSTKVTKSAINKSAIALDKENCQDRKKMTHKEAELQMQEIQRASQRRTREASVSLPYHRPKPRTIKEFLEKRPRFSSTLPKLTSTPPAVAIKMSSTELEQVSKLLKEREKHLQDFYDSDNASDKEDDTQIDKKAVESEKNDSAENNLPVLETLENTNNEITATSESNLSVLEAPENANNETASTSKDVTENNIKNTEMSVECENLEKEITHTTNGEMAHMTDDSAKDANDVLNNVADDSDISTEKRINTLLEKYSEKSQEDRTTESKSKSGIREILKKLQGVHVPKISGGENGLIDLTESTKKTSAVENLKERFFKHISSQKVSKEKTSLSVMNVVNGEVHKEVIDIAADTDKEPPIVNDKPGSKLKKLRGELVSKIYQNRSEMWKQKQLQVSEDQTMESNNEKITKDCSDYEEEAEMTDSVEEEEMDDEDEDDEETLDQKDAKKSACPFIEEEADEADAESEEDGDDTHQGDDEESLSEVEDVVKRKPLKRIISTFSEDSEDSASSDTYASTKMAVENILKDGEMNCTTSEDVASKSGNGPVQTPRKELSCANNELAFLSPVINLTGLQNMNSEIKLPQESPLNISPFSFPSGRPSLNDSRSSLNKNLFPETCEISDAETSMSEVAALCSGKFETQNQNVKEDSEKSEVHNATTNAEVLVEDQSPSTQCLKDICSGKFTVEESLNNTNSQELGEKEAAALSNHDISNYEDGKFFSDDGDKQFISQLLDEEELQRFKKKFDSPVLTDLSKDNISDTGSMLDDDDVEEIQVAKKRHSRKLVFSDSSDDEDQMNEKEEEIDLVDDDGSDKSDAEVEKYIDYDSDENEILVEKVAAPLKIKDFIENEAELSESDWDSEDEDERNMDTYDTEEADKEVFNEDQLKSDLEKIHMRRILDEDNREVKILQELLLEDGELHGSGRQKQFRWKNIDLEDDSDTRVKEDADIYIEDENCEELYRKKRFEREMYLQKEANKTVISQEEEIIKSDSQILRLGSTILNKSQRNSQILRSESIQTVIPTSPTPLLALSNVKRGSFLARKDEVLTRIAQYSKTSIEVALKPTKNPKKMVFQTLDDTSVDKTPQGDALTDKKRKPVHGTPKVLKRLKLDTAFRLTQ